MPGGVGQVMRMWTVNFRLANSRLANSRLANSRLANSRLANPRRHNSGRANSRPANSGLAKSRLAKSRFGLALQVTTVLVMLLAFMVPGQAADPSAAGLWQKIEDGKPVVWVL